MQPSDPISTASRYDSIPRMATSRLRKTAVLLFKLSISAALLYFLFRLGDDKNFARLRDGQKNWALLSAALLVTLGGVSTSFLRWMLLVRALGLPFRTADAFRLGFLGYMLNFFSLGSVGGDLFKAFFIAHEHPGRRAEAVATVVIDRVVGLYALLLVASAAVLMAYLHPQTGSDFGRWVSNATLICTAIATAAVGMLLIPGTTGGRLSFLLGRLPLVGPHVHRLINAIRIYRRKYPIVLIALVMSLAVHCMLTIAVYLIARGLPGAAPSFQEHFVVVPLSLVASALPLPLAGLGAFELALDELYQHVSYGVHVAAGQGLIVALCFRVVTVLIALIGAVYYLRSRREVSETIHELEEDGETAGV